MTRDAARAFARRMNNRPAKPPQTADSEADKAILGLFDRRGITHGAVGAESDEPHHKRVLRILREDRKWQEQYQAEKSQREAEEAEAKLTPGELLIGALKNRSGASEADHLPLNGAALLRQVIGGVGTTTINGQPAR